MRLNDKERSQWIDNDEGLYDLCRHWMMYNKGGQRGFIRANRNIIDSVINQVIDGDQPAHYLKYGGNPIRPLF